MAGTSCFGVFFFHVTCIMLEMPSQEIEQLLSRVAPIQRWGWYIVGLYICGFVIVFFVRDHGADSGGGAGSKK